MNTFREALAPLASQMPRVVREIEILRVVGELGRPNAPDSVSPARREVLAWAQKRCGGRLPKEAWDSQDFEFFFGGRNSAGIRIEEPNFDVWAIRADDPDKTVARRVWTTEVLIGRLNETKTSLTVRLLVSTPEDNMEIEPHVPGIVLQLVDNIGLKCNGRMIQNNPWIIDSQLEVDHLMDLLTDQSRSLPVFVLSTTGEEQGINQPMIDELTLRRATLGIAHVATVHPEYCWALTHRFGKKRSVFNGAVRVYLPGFDDDSTPYDHRLVLAEHLSTADEKSSCLKWMRKLAANESTRRTRLGKDVVSFSYLRNAALQLRQNRIAHTDASDSEKLELAHVQISALEKRVSDLENENNYYLEEHTTIDRQAKDFHRLYNAASFRIQQLIEQIKISGGSPDDGIQMPLNWDDFSEWCDSNLPGRLVLSSTARRSVRSPEFSDIALAARCLLWLANDCRESLLGHSDLQIRDLYFEPRVRNAPCGNDSYEFSWNGQNHQVQWHIKNGGNTRDPSRCLRIYYFFDPTSQQIVVSDMPAHRRTGAS